MFHPVPLRSSGIHESATVDRCKYSIYLIRFAVTYVRRVSVLTT